MIKRWADSPVHAVFEDGHSDEVDLAPFIEEVELTTAQADEIIAKIDAWRAASQLRFNEIAAKLQPGEHFPRFSGQHWPHEGDRDEQIAIESDKARIRWKEPLVAA